MNGVKGKQNLKKIRVTLSIQYVFPTEGKNKVCIKMSVF